MDDTNNNQTATAVREQLERLEWMIADAKRALADAATEFVRRGEDAVKQSAAMMADEPCSLMWTEFAEGNLRTAQEAKARLTNLLEQQNMLRFFLKAE